MREWKLLARASLLRVVASVALGVGLVTFGVFLTLVGGGVLGAGGFWLGKAAGLSEAITSALTVVGAATGWLATAAGLAVSFLKRMTRIFELRLPIGKLSVGADGLSFRQRLRSSFAHFRSVSAVDVVGDEVVVRLDDGEELSFLVEKPKELAAALRHALERFGAHPKTAPIGDLALDDEEGLADWLERVRHLLRGADEYRGGAVTPEALERVAVDPTAGVDQRIGAALALAGGAPEQHVRIRVAVDETANPEVAEALDAALDNELQTETLARATGR